MSASQEPGSIVSLVRLTKLVYKEASEDVLGIKLKAYMTLTSLRDGDLPQQDLCVSMHMDPNNCVIMLNHLEEHGWVERRRDPADRRAYTLHLTAAGRELHGRLKAIAEHEDAQLLAGLDAGERRGLVDALARLASAQGLAPGVHPRLDPGRAD